MLCGQNALLVIYQSDIDFIGYFNFLYVFSDTIYRFLSVLVYINPFPGPWLYKYANYYLIYSLQVSLNIMTCSIHNEKRQTTHSN